jgi:hypothetical protein
MKTVVALFDDFEHARMAVQELHDAGFGGDSINMVARDANGDYTRHLGGTMSEGAQETVEDAAGGAATGAGVGAVLGGLGGLLVGLGALAIPGIGPVLAAGPLAAALTGAGIGAAAGGLVGALSEMGVPETESHNFAEGIRRGGTLITVQTEDERASEAADILNRHHPVNVSRRSEFWRQSGDYGDYDRAQPWTSDQVEAERLRIRQMAEQEENIPITGDPLNPGGVYGTYTYDRMGGGLRGGDMGSSGTGGTGGMGVASGAGTPYPSRETDIEPGISGRDLPSQAAGYGAGFEEGGAYPDYDAGVTGAVDDTPSQAAGYGAGFEKGGAYPGYDAGVSRREVDDEGLGEDAGFTGGRTSATGMTGGTTPGTSATSMGTGGYGAYTSGQSGDVDYHRYDEQFRRHYQTTYGSSGYSYDTYQPVYLFGYNLARDRRYTGRSWDEVEPEARREWEARGEKNLWEEIRDAVREGWNAITH